MKAQILKIAGVKTEAEFYKKFPSEEAFMKKHGKELKKAQYGTYVAGQPEQAQQKPLMYDDLYQDTMANITGVSRQEKARRDALASQQAIAASNSSSSQGQGFGDILKNIDPKMISSAMSAMGGAKNGKKLKKAQTGKFLPSDIPADAFDPQMPSDYQSSNLDNIGRNAFGGVGSFDFAKQDPRMNSKAAIKTGFDYKGALGKLSPALAMQAGPLIGAFQQIEQNKKDITKANQWADISQVASQAALSRPEQSKRRYARPEDNLVTGMNPLGKKDSLLAAQNGAEIQNTFAPNDIYTDMGYEPLNDSNVKQYARGGYLPKAEGGFDFNSLSGLGGGLGGALGSATGKGTGKGGPGSTIGSTALGAIGNILLPGVGGLLGSTVGGFVGGLFDAEGQNELQGAQDRQTAAVNQATIGAGASNLQKANKAFMYNGGYMNPEYNPQVIAKFGDYSMDQLLAPPHDADMLRSGGHLAQVGYTAPSARAMYTGRDLPYQMENGGQMAMGGDLEVHRGQAETMSYNPFLPGGGETIMFRGPSHDNGGMPISYGQNGVEVEGGEPAVKLQDGGSPDGNLVVYGNMIIPDYGVAEIGDPNAKGKKFKNYINDLSKVEAKQNKIVEKHTDSVNDLNVVDTFDKFSLQSSQASIIGANMKLKDIATKKLDTAAVQNAILDTAKEHGLESDALAKGKIKALKSTDKYAKFGAKLTVAQDGLNATKFYEQQQAQQNMINNWPGEPVINTIETPPIPLDYTQGYQQIQSDQDLAGGWPRAADSKQSIAGLLDLLKAKGIDTTISSGTRTGAKTKQGKPSRHAIGEAVDVKFPALGKSAVDAMLGDKDITGNKDWQKSKADILKVYKEDPQAFLGKLDAEQSRYYTSLNANNDFGINKDTAAEFFDDYTGLARYASQQYIPQPQVAREAAISAMPINAPSSATSPIVEPGQPTSMYGGMQLNSIAETLPGSYIPNLADQIAQSKFPWDEVMTGVSSVLPFLRPSNQIPLDPSQLSGELYAMSQNQEEPVFAQSYQPMLSQGINISLQDQLNEITSQSRAAERMAQGNPAALAMIASQAAEAKNKVLGEQFRMNQGEAQRVSETNRQTMNDAQKMNLGLYDQQQQRASQAKSNTKMQNIVALNSINDKIAKQKLENRQIALSENMYNYRFTPNGVAYSMNPLQNFNMYGSGSTKGNGQLAPGKKFSYDENQKIIGTHSVGKDDVAKNGKKVNGSIVKAIKNL